MHRFDGKWLRFNFTDQWSVGNEGRFHDAPSCVGMWMQGCHDGSVHMVMLLTLSHCLSSRWIFIWCIVLVDRQTLVLQLHCKQMYLAAPGHSDVVFSIGNKGMKLGALSRSTALPLWARAPLATGGASSSMHFTAEVGHDNPASESMRDLPIFGDCSFANDVLFFLLVNAKPQRMKAQGVSFGADEVAIAAAHLLRVLEPRKSLLCLDAAKSAPHVVLCPSLLSLDALKTARLWHLGEMQFTHPIAQGWPATQLEALTEILGKIMSVGAETVESSVVIEARPDGTTTLDVLTMLSTDGVAKVLAHGANSFRVWLTPAGVATLVVARVARLEGSGKLLLLPSGSPGADWHQWDLLTWMEREGWVEQVVSKKSKATPFSKGSALVWWSRGSSLQVSKPYLLALVLADQHGQEVPAFRSDGYYLAVIDGRPPPQRVRRQRGFCFTAEGGHDAVLPRKRRKLTVRARPGARKSSDLAAELESALDEVAEADDDDGNLASGDDELGVGSDEGDSDGSSSSDSSTSVAEVIADDDRGWNASSSSDFEECFIGKASHTFGPRPQSMFNNSLTLKIVVGLLKSAFVSSAGRSFHFALHDHPSGGLVLWSPIHLGCQGSLVHLCDAFLSSGWWW